MSDHIGNIWEFRTKNFSVIVSASYDFDTDLSWDDTGEVREKLEAGEYVAFCVKAAIFCNGHELAADYLGGCIYADIHEFRDHIGLAAKSKADGKNYGSYFPQMVRQAIEEARKTLATFPKLRAA